MVRTYKRKTNHQSWSTEAMQQAVMAVLNKELGYRKASMQFKVPQTTLENYVKRNKNKSYKEFVIDKRAGKYKRVFDTEQELELVEYLKNMEQSLFGLTMKDTRRLTYELAERNGCSHRFNKETRMAGQDWMNSFLSRHTEISLRKSVGTSVPCRMGFNKPAVSKFFDLLTECIDKYGLTAENIYNCGKTNITLDPIGHSKLLSMKGWRRAGVLTSGEHTEIVTAEICFSAAGVYMPPMLIYPRTRTHQGFETGLPAGTWIELHETGWIESDIFVKWFRKFVEFSKPSKDSPVLLLLDGHTSDIKNLELVDLARDNGVLLLCFPPHCTHKLQPLDVAIMKPLSISFEEEVRKWMLSNPGEVVTLWQLSSLFGAAFVNAAKTRTAVNGFRETGIWPSDMNVFPEEDFVPIQTTHIQLDDSAANGEIVYLAKIEESGQISDSEAETVLTTRPQGKIINHPCCSSTMGNTKSSQQVEASCFSNPTIEIALLIPKVELQTTHDEDDYFRESKEDYFRNKLLQYPEEGPMVKRMKSEKLEREKQTRIIRAPPNSSDSSTDEASVKGYLYWISCSRCYSWAHSSCAGVKSSDDETPYICELCMG